MLRDRDSDEAGHLQIRLVDEAERGCCGEAHHETSRIVPQRYGAPFLLGNAMPLLLAATPSLGSNRALPSGGRRLLSFTDSRQGTARFAAKLQQEAERNLTRAAIWHGVQEAGKADPDKAASLMQDIAGLEVAVKAVPSLVTMLDEKRKELAEAEGGPSPVAWSKMIARFAENPELRDFAGAVWRGRPAGGETLSKEPVRLAEFFLLRELFRRPKMQNNAETMGLARIVFPEMEKKVTDASVPAPLREAGLGADAWQGLLYFAIDAVFRTNLAVKMEQNPVDLAHWISPRQKTKQIVQPEAFAGERLDRNSQIRWPNKNSRQTRLVQAIYSLTKGSSDSPIDQDRCGDVLSALWTALRTSGVIVGADPGCWQLDFGKSALMQQDTAWLCPTSNRLVPYTISGVSPNAAETGGKAVALPMPPLPIANVAGMTEAERERVTDWTKTDPTVQALRQRGLWTSLHDRAAEFAPFLRAQEHSAQIDRRSLQGYEARLQSRQDQHPQLLDHDGDGRRHPERRYGGEHQRAAGTRRTTASASAEPAGAASPGRWPSPSAKTARSTGRCSTGPKAFLQRRNRRPCRPARQRGHRRRVM